VNAPGAPQSPIAGPDAVGLPYLVNAQAGVGDGGEDLGPQPGDGLGRQGLVEVVELQPPVGVALAQQGELVAVARGAAKVPVPELDVLRIAEAAGALQPQPQPDPVQDLAGDRSRDADGQLFVERRLSALPGQGRGRGTSQSCSSRKCTKNPAAESSSGPVCI
jgi:hypothetical protein